MMKFKLLVYMSITLLLISMLIGCGGVADTANDSQVRHGTSDVNRTEQLVLFVAEGLPKDYRETLEHCVASYLEHAGAGSYLQIYRCPDHYLLASIQIPEGTKQHRFRSIGEGLNEFVAFLQDESEVPADFAQQVGAPVVPASIWSSNSANESQTIPTFVAVFGDPIYFDPAEPVWSFRGRRLPSLSSILDPSSTSPFLVTAEHSPLPDGTKLLWVAPTSFVDHEVQDAMRLFYRQYFDQHSIELIDFSNDIVDAFQNSTRDLESKIPINRDAVDMEPPRMITLPPAQAAPAFGDALGSETPESIRNEVLKAKSNGSTLLALNWQSKASDTDIDLWISRRDSPGVEVNFENQSADFAYLVRDVRSSGTLSSNSHADYMAWELAYLKSPLPSIELWLNSYVNSAADAACLLLLVHQGSIYQKKIDMKVPGDRAEARGHRSRSTCWKKIEVNQMLGTVASR